MGVGVKKKLRELTNQFFSNRAGESYSSHLFASGPASAPGRRWGLHFQLTSQVILLYTEI